MIRIHYTVLVFLFLASFSFAATTEEKVKELLDMRTRPTVSDIVRVFKKLPKQNPLSQHNGQTPPQSKYAASHMPTGMAPS